ncbi:hypothetical protein EDD32_2587 [Georgenia muralis]|uniref:Uncharacterized protein n=2 Tax=Georgenia muralis TaxID=154117 RepID=A0A3N4ZRC2_9MICO|nr:hypothetical protein EDD32_2587 [Georgenia muralis]
MIVEPGLRHLLEERERRRHEVQIPGSAAPPFGIDLDAGVAYIDVPPADSAAAVTDAADAVTDAADDGARPGAATDA